MKTSKTINKLIIFLITLTVVSCTKDNPEPLIPIIEKYDTLIFATPVYWYSMSGIMKVFFDRKNDNLLNSS